MINSAPMKSPPAYSAADFLDRARRLITPPDRFIGTAYARDSKGNPLIRGCHDNATGWSEFAAIEYVMAGRSHEDAPFDALVAACKELHGLTPSKVSSTLGHEAILRAFDHAIATEMAALMPAEAAAAQ